MGEINDLDIIKNRRRFVEVSIDALKHILANGPHLAFTLENGLPESARITDAYYDEKKRMLVLTVIDRSFADLEDDETTPTHPDMVAIQVVR